MNTYEIAGVVFGIIAVWLTVRQNIWCWPTGIVNVAMFVVVFFQSKLYADMGLQVVYLILSIYGWWAWLHGSENRGPLQVSRSTIAYLGTLAAIGTTAGFFIGFALDRGTDASIPYWDSFTTSYSLVAQWLLTKKRIENWILWIAVDIVYVGMYIYKGLYLTAGLYLVFLGLAVAGWIGWKKSIHSGIDTTA